MLLQIYETNLEQNQHNFYQILCGFIYKHLFFLFSFNIYFLQLSAFKYETTGKPSIVLSMLFLFIMDLCIWYNINNTICCNNTLKGIITTFIRETTWTFTTKSQRNLSSHCLPIPALGLIYEYIDYIKKVIYGSARFFLVKKIKKKIKTRFFFLLAN